MLYKLLTTCCLLANFGLFAWSIVNKTDTRVNIKAHYNGQTSFSCRSDNFWLAPHEVKEIGAGWCDLRYITSGDRGVGSLDNPKGSRFIVDTDFKIKPHP